jgi:hypothetical protein
MVSCVRFLVAASYRVPVALQPRHLTPRVRQFVRERIARQAEREQVCYPNVSPELLRNLRSPCAHASTTITPGPGSSTARGILHLKLFEVPPLPHVIDIFRVQTYPQVSTLGSGNRPMRS